MNRKIRFLSVAQQEMDESFAYYEQQVTGLGHDFLAEILATLKRIKKNPEAWHSFSNRPATAPPLPCSITLAR